MRRLLAAVLPLLLLAACGGAGDSGDADPDNPISVDFAASATNALPWLVAKENGFFEARGVDVEKITLGDGGSSTLRSALAGGAPVAEVSFTAAVDAIEQGAEIEIVSGSLNTAVGVDFYALADNDAINSIEDVERLGVTSPGSISETVTTLALDELGVAKREFVHTGGIGEGIALLESGDVDVTFITPPVAAELGDKIKPILRASDELGAIQTSVIVATKSYASEHPKAVEALIASLEDASDQIAKHPQAAAERWAPELDLSAEQIRPYIDRINQSPNVWGVGFNTEVLDRAAHALTLTGHSGEVDYCSILSDAYLPDGAPSGPLENC